MALTVHPTDGFINRLLQQTTRTAPQPAAEKSGDLGARDQVSISPEARQVTTSLSPDARLESKLLQMYNQNGESSS